MNKLICPILFCLTLLARAAEPLPVLGKTVPLFDGKTLAGWEGNPAIFRVQDGLITGGSLTETVKQNEFLASTRDFGDFVVRFKIKMTSSEGFTNSGFQIRSQRLPNNNEMIGYQCDYGDPTWWAGIYDESRRNTFISPSDMKALEPVIKRNDWNEYTIRAIGPRITTWLNGVQGTDYVEAEPGIPETGKFGIQVHGGGKVLVQVKDIEIQEFPPAEKVIGAPEPGKAVKASPLTPEEERAAFTLPPGFEVELVAAEDEASGVGKFVPIAFDQKGALWTTTALEYPVDGNENPGAADALYASKAKDKVLVYDRDPSQPSGFAAKARVFAEGLAIPLGVLPYKNGCYVQHGHDIAFLEDTDADGKADKRTVILTGFGVQDSHLFPHQFLRAPGGYIWMAQGAFNYSKVRQPNQPAEKAVQFDQTRMAKFRPDGSGFDITSNGPCNIWGLVLNGEGEAFIQEANDFGYPVMPFHEYANYPGCSDSQWKTYAPEYPGTATFKVGGTGLSGLALTDKAGPFPSPWRDVMLVANPITNRINAIKMRGSGSSLQLQRLPDFVASTDPWFRPVAVTTGPDGCVYIVDWYNKIISHNEVPRNHPERDKTRGRIWRVKATAQKPLDVPDFTKLTGDQLIAKLGGPSLAQSHLAWQTIADRGAKELTPKLRAIVLSGKADKVNESARIAALWALRELSDPEFPALCEQLVTSDANGNVRREALAALPVLPNWTPEKLAALSNDTDAGVRAELIKRLGAQPDGDSTPSGIPALLALGRESLAAPIAPSTRNGKPIRVREAYDREFERYLVRMFLERQPAAVAKFLDSPAAGSLPVESRLLASLALEPKASAARVAKLLPQLQRAPGEEEILRLVQFPEEPGVADALKSTLGNPETSKRMLEALLAVRSRIDAAKLTPMLNGAARALLTSGQPAQTELGMRLASSFQLSGVEADLVPLVEAGASTQAGRIAALLALGELHSERADLFAKIAADGDRAVREAALTALAASRASNAPALLLGQKLTSTERRTAMERLAATKAGAQSVVAALQTGTIPKADLDGATLDKLQAVLGEKDPALAALTQELGAFFRPVLELNGTDEAYSELGLSLDGAFTIETWVRFNPALVGRKGMTNADGILGAPEQIDINFFDSTLRVWVGGGVNDAIISKKPLVPGIWTHVAITRNADGRFKLYQDGELDNDDSKPVTRKFENVRLGWTAVPGGLSGALSEFRVWNIERSASAIRHDVDRVLQVGKDPANPGLVFRGGGEAGWGKLKAGAKVVKTSDLPPIVTADEAATLDAKYAKYRGLAEHPGDAVRGQMASAICQACHLMGTTGGNIGPNLSGVGAMGTEGILRNILQPNAAMENGYRIYRVELKNGDLIDALYVREDKDAVIVRMPGSEDRRIPRAEIREAKYLRRSLMPEGLLDGMVPEQVSDLFAYLKTLK